MPTETNQKLLKNKKVIEEINRHRWIESEKAGYDVGFEQASIQWLEEFSKAWMKYHMPKQKIPVSKFISSKRTSSKRSTRTKTKARKT